MQVIVYGGFDSDSGQDSGVATDEQSRFFGQGESCWARDI